MEKRHEFIEKTLYLIRKEFEKKLPKEATLEEMISRAKKIIVKIIK